VHNRLVLLSAIAGAAVAVGAVCFLPLLSNEDQMIFALVLFVMPAAGVAVANSSQRILGAYTLSMLLPAAYVWAQIHPGQLVTAYGLTVVYCVFLIIVSADGEQLLRRSIIIRNQRDQVVKELERSNADVREAMARAEQSAHARARVLASASHDLRQPLHALSIYSAILSADPAPETLREVGRNIDQIIRSLGTLLNGLLDLSRLSVGHYVPETQLFSLQRVLGDVCDEFELSAAAKQLTLIRNLDVVTLRGDALAVARIARNLIDNAIKYTERGTIRIDAFVEQEAGANAVLRIADTGKGILLAEQDRIFEEFYQLENPGRDRSRGVGLGLAIVQRLVELIQAKLSIVSTPGLGTQFTVLLPGVSATTPLQRADDAPPRQPFNGRRIYVVDDEPDILKSMDMLLGLWGAATESATSPAAAEQLLREHGKPDLLIIDLRLGGDEHGVQLASRFQREHGPFPVLVITGETSSAALRDANEQAYVLLQKPIAPEVLRAAISDALEKAAANAINA
jgi:signal transduction histidine kinase/ActR/RegA family two-component response regulator